MRVFVTGVAGQLGHDVVNELISRGYEAVGSDILPEYDLSVRYVSLDITDRAAVEQTIEEIKPDAIVHCAAWTAVDAAEDADKQEKVKAINVDGTQNIANAAKNTYTKIDKQNLDKARATEYAKHVGVHQFLNDYPTAKK